MNRHLSDLPDEGEQRDPVADFFARERADIRDLPAGADRWESILVEARRPVRRSWLPYLAGAAAVVLVGGVLWGNGRGPGTDRAADPASSTAAVSTATVSATEATTLAQPSATGGTSSPGTPTATTFPAPNSFDIVSMTNAGGKHLFALGKATCPKGECTAVIGSDDDGATWTTRASFTTLTSPGPRTTPADPGQVVGIRFANPQVGYVYGSTTMRTVDGGRHWDPVDVSGRTVLSLETDGKQVWMVTASSCLLSEKGTRGCAGLEVWSTDVTGAKAAKVVGLDTPAPADGAWLSMDGTDAYVSVSYEDQEAQSLPQRVSGTPNPVSRPRGCASTGGVWVWGTARTRGALVAVCRASGAPGKSYALATSTDSGRSWSPAQASPDLATPGAPGVWLTAADLRHFVVVLQGLTVSIPAYQNATAILSTRDGGATWARPRLDQGADDSFVWVGAAGGPIVYAVARGGRYDVSTDSGASFEQRSFRK
ncbi:hypothetical protein [Pedococcus sp. P5_B7]